ncbi:MAG TPA: histidine kinase dimerization/phosphoacceptor domain -containing protein [Ignavibacteriaceae bacterium]|nr:histidine kinase dimerization/phosphoacceptor domain -containing protein [Ignavibacteriaceae bacterium]
MQEIKSKKDREILHPLKGKTKDELIKHINTLQDKLKQFESMKGELSSKDKLLYRMIEKEYELDKGKIELLEVQNMLEYSLNKYADLYDYAPIGYMSLDENGIITEINLTGASIFRKQREELINLSFISLLSTKDIKKFFAYLNNSRRADDQSLPTGDFVLNLETAEPVSIKTFITPVTDYESRKLSFRIAVYDDSARKKTERALKESEIKFSSLADNVPVLIWIYNREEELEYINKQRFEFTGLSLEQDGDRWFENIHPQDKEMYIRKFRDAFKLKKKFSIEYRVKNYSNDYHWLLETTIPRFSEENEFVGLIGTGIDITERKKAHIAVDNALKEKELLVKEIHHRVKNNLQIVSSLLNLQSFYVKDPKILDLIKGSQERIRSMALVHEKLYRSKDLLKIDFEEYSKELISHLFQSYRKNMNIRLNLDIHRILLEINTAISLGLILNELVSNSLKYAFNGRKEGVISVILLLKKRNKLELVVRDDGIGFPKDFDIANSEGMGLELVESLVQQHNGSLNIIKDGKTEFQISIEMEKEKPKPDGFLLGNESP